MESHDGGRLESEISLEVLGDLTDEALERSFLEKKVRGLLLATDLTHGDSSRAELVGLLHTRRSSLAGGFGSQLLAGSLASSGFAGGLLSACHS